MERRNDYGMRSVGVTPIVRKFGKLKNEIIMKRGSLWGSLGKRHRETPFFRAFFLWAKFKSHLPHWLRSLSNLEKSRLEGFFVVKNE